MTLYEATALKLLSGFSLMNNLGIFWQKTLPVMVAVVEQLGGALGESGLLVLPCVAAHLNQVVLTSIHLCHVFSISFFLTDNYWYRLFWTHFLLTTGFAKISQPTMPKYHEYQECGS